jgi:hypothetical protein
LDWRGTPLRGLTGFGCQTADQADQSRSPLKLPNREQPSQENPFLQNLYCLDRIKDISPFTFDSHHTSYITVSACSNFRAIWGRISITQHNVQTSFGTRFQNRILFMRIRPKILAWIQFEYEIESESRLLFIRNTMVLVSTNKHNKFIRAVV